MTGGCLLVAFAPDGATGNDDEYDISYASQKERELKQSTVSVADQEKKFK